MPTTGVTLSVIGAKVITPIVQDLYAAAKGSVKTSLNKWSSSQAAKKLATKISKLEKVKTIWQFEKEVSLRQFYYPSRLKIDGRVTQKAVNTLADLGPGNAVIEGIVGQGKSIFLRYLAIQELTNEGSSRIPLFIELRNIQSKTELQSLIFDALEKLEIKAEYEVFSYLAESGRLVLLLDGFDELEESVVGSVFREIEDLAERYDALQIIVTSRPYNEIQKSPHFHCFEIAPIGNDDYFPFFRKIGLDSTKAAEIKNAILTSRNDIQALISTPLMLTLVVLVYKAEQQIPSDLPEFFDQLFQTVFVRHDKAKPAFRRKHYSGLGERALRKLFESFCFMVLQNGFNRSLNSKQFDIAFEQAKRHTDGATCESEEFRKDLTKVACLLLEEGLDQISFLHMSLLEYYAASYIRDCRDAMAEKFYGATLHKHNRWEVVHRFLSQIDKYRFTKFYALPSYKHYLTACNALIGEPTDSDLLKYLNESVVSTCEVTLIEDQKRNEIVIAGLGRLSWGQIYWDHMMIANYFIDGITETIPIGIRDLDHVSRYEPPRIWWRLQLLREWSYEQETKQIFA